MCSQKFRKKTNHLFLETEMTKYVLQLYIYMATSTGFHMLSKFVQEQCLRSDTWVFLTNLTRNHTKHGFRFSSSILETLDKTTACIVFGTQGILGTVIGFGVVVKLLTKIFVKCFVRCENLTGFQHREFSTKHNSQECWSNQMKFSSLM